MRLLSQKEMMPVVYGEYPVKCFRVSAQAGELVFSLHWHERMELHRVVEGSLSLYCGDEHRTLCAGELSVVSPQLLHRGVAGPEGVTYEVVMFDVLPLVNRTAATQWLKEVDSGKTVFETQTNHENVIAAVDRVLEAYYRENTHPLETVGLLYELLGTLYCFGGVKAQAPPPLEKWFGQVISYINEQFAKPISSASLSARFGYDEAYFCRKFKHVTGITVMRYIRILRLEQARNLLTETEQSVSDIALACGFSDAAYFANCFKAQYGITPTVLRQQTKSASGVTACFKRERG